jgi:branched-chain amino acid transport system ATP-binding protein
MPMLELSGVEVSYGAVRAVKGIDLSVERGEIVTLLGPNGAGKSSTLLGIMGVVPPRSGSIRFDGRPLAGLAPELVVRSGLALVPEGRRIFAPLTVAENLLLGASGNRDRGTLAADLEEMNALFPILAQRRNQLAGTLSGGEQQMLAIARCLMGRPAMILLDEPSLGLAPQIIDTIFDLIVRLRGRGHTILLVEQNVELSLAIADRGYLLVNGEIVMSGTAESLRSSEGVERAYLGLVEA